MSSVNKKLKYLIIGEKPTKRKVEQAKELGIKILSQKAVKFIRLVWLTIFFHFDLKKVKSYYKLQSGI